MPRRLNAIGAALSLLFIAVATLTPAGGRVASSGVLCLGCGSFGLTDLVLNVMLFAPLGIVLGRAGRRVLPAIGVGLLLKGLIAAVFPIAGGVVYLLASGQVFSGRTWRRIRPFSGALIILVIAAPWHILATLANPPYLDFTMKSEPGKYHGFFWFYIFNEHLFRFLNMRHPRDYNTVPRHLFWLFHFLWLFPWSVYIPAAVRQSINQT